MRMSRRARRMERQHNKSKTPPLNLVSLMDIFTILVFFLLVNSSNTQQLPSRKDMKLPNSMSEVAPKETLLIAITQKEILIEGVSVGQIDSVLKSTDATIPALKEELIYLDKKSTKLPAEGGEKAITIMGDENTSYDLIKKILTTCQEVQYTKIAFAATQKLQPKK